MRITIFSCNSSDETQCTFKRLHLRMKAGNTRMVAARNDIHSKQNLELTQPYSRFIFVLILRDSTGIFSINFCHCHVRRSLTWSNLFQALCLLRETQRFNWRLWKEISKQWKPGTYYCMSNALGAALPFSVYLLQVKSKVRLNSVLTRLFSIFCFKKARFKNRGLCFLL